MNASLEEQRAQRIQLEHESGFSFEDHEEHIEVNEMMVIEINFGKGKKGDVVVRYGDDPHALALTFISEHGLKESALGVVENHIRTTMEEFVASLEMRPQTPPMEEEQSVDEIASSSSASALGSPPDSSAFLHHPAADLPPSPSNEARSAPNVSFGLSPIPQKSKAAQQKEATPAAASSGDHPASSSGKKKAVSSAPPKPVRSNAKSAAIAASRARSTPSPTPRAAQSSANKDKSPRDKIPAHEPGNNTTIASPSGAASASTSASNNEQMYNALKQSTAAATSRGAAPAPHLQPASKTLALNRSIGLHAGMATMHQLQSEGGAGNNQSKGSFGLGSSLGASISKLSERLYRSAAVQKDRLGKMRQAEEDAQAKELRENQYRLSDASRALAGNYKSVGHDDIALRLYDEGCKDLAKRKKNAADNPEPAAIETWSCVKCGTFHSLPMKTASDKARAPAVSRKCPSCGWETNDSECSFKPTLIGLELAGSGPFQPTAEQLLSRRNEAKSMFHSVVATSKALGKRLSKMRELWRSRDAEEPFKPTIPDSSNRILQESIRRAQSQSQTQTQTQTLTQTQTQSQSQYQTGQQLAASRPGMAVSTGQYFQQPAADRLSRQLRPTPRRIVTLPGGELFVLASTNGQVPQPPKRLERPSAQVAAFVDRMVGEYKEREVRRAALADRFYTTDERTGERLWVPHCGPPPKQGGVSTLYSTERSNGSKHRDIVEALYLKDKKSKDKIAAMASEKRKREEQEDLDEAKMQGTSLQSDAILREALDRSIEEMFRLLYVSTTAAANPKQSLIPRLPPAGVSVQADLRRAQMLSKASQGLAQVESLVLDLQLVQPDMMIPEVTALLVEVRRERAAQAEADGNYAPSSLPTSYKEFARLVRKCVRQREGVGKHYLYAPKKRAEVALQMVLEEQREETFKPTINPASAAAMAHRGREGRADGRGRVTKGYRVETLLAREAAKTQEKVEAARKEKHAKEGRELTFKPRLFKAPKNVQPRYRGLPKTEPAKENSPPPPPTAHIPFQHPAAPATASKVSQAAIPHSQPSSSSPTASTTAAIAAASAALAATGPQASAATAARRRRGQGVDVGVREWVE